ncbi:MAG TPA: cysteine--tRNA ligase [Thermomicrobiales bacterium]|nr:cysteine--tRNA ligase [Thermomicrobiales bacterium]
MSETTASQLQIYSTLSRTKEPFVTIEPGKVRMYVCGVTVYDDAHIGHGMSAIIFDVIRRYLTYSGYEVNFARNFTDIDDKIINRANQEETSPDELTSRLIADWTREIEELNIVPATITPRATTEIPAIVEMIEGLIEKGYAYQSAGDVYFRVRSFPGYGKLSHRKIDELVSGARIEIAEIKEDPLDFALWKAAKPGEPSWESPWSAGRPGWHIECSAMCTHHLGGLVDIHGGGSDLIFPHHENEIAQSEAYLGEEPYARFWLHNGMLRLDGEKMSKSLGNVVRLKDLLARGRGAAFRLMVLQSHYRQPVNYTEDALQAAENGLSRLRSAISAVGTGEGRDVDLETIAAKSRTDFRTAMDDDFDTASALAAVFDLGRAINRVAATGAGAASVATAQDVLRELTDVLGLDLQVPADEVPSDAAPFIDLLLSIRQDLRAAKQFAIADSIRNQLTELGVTLEDTATGTIWKKS